MENNLDISIVIVTKNRSDRLKTCIKHILDSETSYTFELIVADNGSTDDTRGVIESFSLKDARVKYISVPLGGCGAGKDIAWRHSTAEIVAFTDDDCYVESGYIDAIMAAFKRYPDAGCIGGRILLFDPMDAPVTIDTREHRFCIKPYSFVKGGEIQGANFSFRREALARSGGFDHMLGPGTRFTAGEDIDAVAATCWAGFEIRFEPEIIVYHHHGRRGNAVKKIGRNYDRGRGVYYAKFLLRVDTRAAYIQGWKEAADSELPIRGIRSLAARCREIYSAVQYLRIRRRLSFIPGFIVYTVVHFVYLVFLLIRGGKLKLHR